MSELEPKTDGEAEAIEAIEATETTEARRKLLRLGLYAAYTAPLLIAMTTSAKAAVCSNCAV
jgi:hypothetical protein